MCKILQHLSNGTLSNEANMEQFNIIISENKKDFQDFISRLPVSSNSHIFENIF